MPEQWRETSGGMDPWNNNAIIKIFEAENDYNEYICTQSNCESIWISIDATNSNLNNKGGEFKFHSIVNNRPAYHNSNSDYLAYNDKNDEWLIMSEYSIVNGVTGGWFLRAASKGTLKNF